MGRKTGDDYASRENRKFESTSSIDAFVGARIRRRRTFRSFSQTRMAELLDITLRQVQQYESGVSRVGATRLFEVARVLGTPVSYFFDDMPQVTSRVSDSKLADHILNTISRRAPLDGFSDEVFGKQETMELVYAFYRIPEDVRGLMLDLIKSLATPDVSH